MTKNLLQRQIASGVFGFVVLCALTVSSIAKADDDCDTPSAESCACQSQMSKTDPQVKRGSNRLVAVAKEKTARRAETKPPQAKDQSL